MVAASAFVSSADFHGLSYPPTIDLYLKYHAKPMNVMFQADGAYWVVRPYVLAVSRSSAPPLPFRGRGPHITAESHTTPFVFDITRPPPLHDAVESLPPTSPAATDSDGRPLPLVTSRSIREASRLGRGTANRADGAPNGKCSLTRGHGDHDSKSCAFVLWLFSPQKHRTGAGLMTI
ncbi:hypothetical protein EJ04DRAFT_525104 [Polyplosphaeria fusca]|uniref:Uncharacterized protein n=1 Tax=Polyplosphaeria fusca TaxID=682080 RepID=A0A9P4QXI0_9PLEO|nr:hypothetical protein EJ04DRAFT_525104 [Polyplosphaeria fusca]